MRLSDSDLRGRTVVGSDGRVVGALSGFVVDVVVERVEGGLARGTSRRYATVRWPATDERRGHLVRVRVEASDGQECFGISARNFASRLPP